MTLLVLSDEWVTYAMAIMFNFVQFIDQQIYKFLASKPYGLGPFLYLNSALII